jgi:hypothetical protein
MANPEPSCIVARYLRMAPIATVTTLAVGAMAATAGPAVALPSRCDWLIDWTGYDRYQARKQRFQY